MSEADIQLRVQPGAPLPGSWPEAPQPGTPIELKDGIRVEVNESGEAPAERGAVWRIVATVAQLAVAAEAAALWLHGLQQHRAAEIAEVQINSVPVDSSNREELERTLREQLGRQPTAASAERTGGDQLITAAADLSALDSSVIPCHCRVSCDRTRLTPPILQRSMTSS